MKDTTVIGVAGCGAMGLPMARQLQKAGFSVWGFDVRPADGFKDFASRMIEDPSEFSARIDTLITVVRDQHQNMDLLFDNQAIMRRENPPKTVIISSTLSPRFLPEMDKLLPPGTSLVDAPMSGAPARAEDGTLTFMVGGNNEVVSDLMILFKVMGNDVHHLGSTGMGMTCKVINNFVAVTGFAAVRKALITADILGLQHQQLLKVMRRSSGSTWYGDNLDRISWAREGYGTGNTIGILEKDMLSFLDTISGWGDIEVENLAGSVLDIIRAVEPLE